MIESLWLKNFRRYRDEFFRFSEGINFIDGENNAGKTTLFYAIEYALFGRVANFRALHGLMHPKQRSMGVELVFLGKGGYRYRLQRMHELPPRSRTKVVGHFTLKRSLSPIVGGNGERVEENEKTKANEIYLLSSDFQDREEALALKLYEASGLSRRLFEVAVNLKQGEIASILEGAPQLDNVLGVTASVAAAGEMRGIALEYEKEAKGFDFVKETWMRLQQDKSSLGEKQSALEKEHGELGEQVERLKMRGSEVSVLDAFRKKVETEQKSLRHALDSLASLERRIASTKKTLVDLEAKGSEDDMHDRIADVKKRSEMAEKKRDEHEANLSKLDEARGELDQQKGDLNGRIRRREALPSGEDAQCETCGQPIDAVKNEKEIASWKGELAVIDEELAENQGKREACRTEEKELFEQIRGWKQELKEHKGHIESLKKYRAQVDASAEEVELATAKVNDAVANLQSAIQAYQEKQIEQAEKAGDGWGVFAIVVEAGMLDGIGESVEKQRAALEEVLGQLQENVVEVRDATNALRVQSETEQKASAANQARVARELTEVQERSQSLERDIAQAQKQMDELQTKKQTAEKLRKLAAAFKSVQLQLRERASATLAKDTLALHEMLSAPQKEYEKLSIDPAKYTIQVTPKDLGKEVPAALFQGGGHRLLLGLAFKFAIARMVGPCPFVLLDEPTYGLDEVRRGNLLERINSMKAAEQMLLITHHDLGGASGHRVRIEKHEGQSKQAVAEGETASALSS